MDLNNKFGQCCKCPGLMNYNRDLTQWESSKIYEIELMNRLKLNNIVDYKINLQDNTEKILNNTITEYNNNYRCQHGNNIYLDSSDFHKKFDNYFQNNNVPMKNINVLPIQIDKLSLTNIKY